MPKALYTDRNKQLLERLITLRKQAKLTQSVVAIRISKPQSFVAKYERGERRLDLLEFLDVAEAIGFDPEKFVRALRTKT
jgi:transcriptional regulator with XRE-family HTH domain